MKRLFSYYILVLIAGAALLASCADDTLGDKELTNGQVGLKLALNLPSGRSASTRVGGTDSSTSTEPGNDFENQLSSTDIRLLIFQNDTFKEEVTTLQLTGSTTSPTRFLEGTTENAYDGTVEIVVLANLKSRGVAPQVSEFESKTVEQVYQMMKYTYGEDAWTLSNTKRIPMWGSLSMVLHKGEVSRGNIDLYRAVAKVNFTVNQGEGLDNFTLRSIDVFYANTEGYCAPLPSDATVENAETQFTRTSVPSSSQSFQAPLHYLLSEKGEVNIFKDRIYLPESNNKAPSEGKKPLCIVVGGIYAGEGLVDSGEISYYRIDFKDALESGSGEDLRMYDVIRNHSYQFNIRSVKNPGTSTPEEALDHVVVGMTVEITAWVDEPMRGIPDQYTLTTDKSRVTFNPSSTTETIKVWTDYGPTLNDWELDLTNVPSWFTVEKNGQDYVHITAKENCGVGREGSFYVQAGNLKKQIVVYQSQPLTANSYVIGEGKHELIVTIKGNGNDGVYVMSDKGSGLVKLVESNQDDASIHPDKIGIIWETKAGLITLIDKQGTSVRGKGQFAEYDKEKGIINYTVDSHDAFIGGIRGGNALIGAFTNDGVLLWSWHIWVCQDMVEANGSIKEQCIQDWSINGYHVMDRNLGALDNKPGVASLGLLYQWGRKDPFIGASVTNDNYSGSGVLPTEIYYDSWNVSGSEDTPMSIPQTILHPTTLTKAGMSKGSDNRKALLWGTDGGLNTNKVKDLGTKTIYDPCPIGYRVPPVDAFVFETDRIARSYSAKVNYVDITDFDGRKYHEGPIYIRTWNNGNNVWNNWVYRGNGATTDGKHQTASACIAYTPSQWEVVQKSNETYNWNENLKYVPHNATGRNWQAEQYISNYTGPYIANADFYGFYLNYKAIEEPELTLEFKKNSDNQLYFYQPSDKTHLAWLPLSGAYDPHSNTTLTFKEVQIEQGSSITVNSFLWTNSSVISGRGLIPAAMFLHGTEVRGGGSGRHIHGLTQSDINTQPHYAGAVRCVRDVQKDFSVSNKVPDAITLNGAINSVTSATLVSVNDTWRVIDAGAPWFRITPDRGVADKNKGQEIVFTAIEANHTGSPRTATVLIQFSQEQKPRQIKVTQIR